MAAIGGITVLIGAALAFVQDDIKKVLAYSTISQLGYMVMALGVGAWIAAVFHLFTHAFFKANLFLGAGSVSHSGAHHSFDMKKDMGGLKKYMPQTFWTFMIGSRRARGHLPARRVLVEGRDPRERERERLRPVPGRRAHRRLHDGCVHDALRVPHVLRRVPRRPSRRSARRSDVGDELVEHDLADVAARRTTSAHHGEPHESNGLITVPLWMLVVLLAVRRPAERARASRSSPSGSNRAFAFPELRARRVLDRVGRALRDRRAARRRARRTRTTGGTSARSGSPSATALAHAGKQFLVKKYYLDVLYTDVIVGVDQGPDRARRLLVQPARHRQRPQLHRSGRAVARAGSPTTTSTRRVSTASSTASASAPVKRAARSARSRPVVCSSTHSCSSGGGGVRPHAVDRGLAEGIELDGTGSTLGTEPRGLRPAVGAVIVMLIPRAKRS